MSGRTGDPIPSVAVDAQGIGRRLFDAFESGVAVEPPSQELPELDVPTAYAAQRHLIELHGRRGRTVRGYKIGLTSQAIQRQLGVATPDFGALLDSHTFDSGIELSRAEERMIAPRVEAELAFVLAHPVLGPGVTAQQVLAATESIVPVFEIIDSRIADWRITLPDTVADNASCFGAVVGDPVAVAEIGDVADIALVLERDGREAARGTAAAVLGHPARAVAWLANELGRFGTELPAGAPVLSGSFTVAVDATPGRFVARFSAPVPPVELTIRP